MSIRPRVGVLLAATTLLTNATIAVTTIPANATTPASAASFTFSYEPDWGDGQIVIYNNGQRAGRVWWNRDPVPVNYYTTKGDTLCVQDELADGWGIKGNLYWATGHDVSTGGHTAGYYECNSGDLPEDKAYYIEAVVDRDGSTATWSDWVKVFS